MAENELTKLANLINPEVMADMISGKIEKKIVVTPFAKIDSTLQGRPGNTITIPKYAYIGAAEEVAEGEYVTRTKLTASTTTATVKKIMKDVALTDEAVLSAYGEPVAEANSQIATSLADKIDEDAMTTLQTAALSLTSDSIIGYSGIVNAIDVFEEEFNTEKVIFVHPKQVSQLRLDPDFMSADKYGASEDVVMRGEIGKIANCRVVPSKKVPLKSGNYICPIVKLTRDNETEDETSAITIFLKRDTMIETKREAENSTTMIIANKHYTVALTDESKVVLAKFKANTTTTTG